MARISGGEREFVLGGIRDDVRGDGRGCGDLRPMVLSTGILDMASGSARVCVGGVTELIVGIKAEIVCPEVVVVGKGEDEGILEFSVECSGLASPEFEGRGAQELNAELGVGLARLFGGDGCAGLRKGLCLIKGRRVWKLMVDCVVLDSGGGLLQALSVGVRAALRSCLLPGVEVVRGEADEEDEIDVDEDVVGLVVGAELCPAGVCLAVMENGALVVDPSLEEEVCADVVMNVGVNLHGRVCGVVKSGTAGLDFDRLASVLEEAKRVGLMVIKRTDALLDEDLAVLRENEDQVVPNEA